MCHMVLGNKVTKMREEKHIIIFYFYFLALGSVLAFFFSLVSGVNDSEYYMADMS